MDRRSVQRIAVQLPVTYQGAGVLGTAVVTMLSSAGCTIARVKAAGLPVYLELTIALPDHTVLVKTGAAIRWKGNDFFGAEYLILTKSDAHALARFIEMLWVGQTQERAGTSRGPHEECSADQDPPQYTRR